jgi:tRNA threonylcarbamoyladenosine biosynthesis protein TsaE
LNTAVNYSLDNLPQLASTLVESAKDVRIIAFTGNLGAGKTTIIKEILKKLGVNHFSGSPTFSLVNEYESKDKEDIFHFDFYRIENESEVLDIGWEEYVNNEKSWLLIEWPEKIENLLPDNFLHVNIRQEASERLFEWKLF